MVAYRVVITKWALSSSSSKSLGGHSSGSLDKAHLSSSTVSNLENLEELEKHVLTYSGESINHGGLDIDHVSFVETDVGFLCLDLSS